MTIRTMAIMTKMAMLPTHAIVPTVELTYLPVSCPMCFHAEVEEAPPPPTLDADCFMECASSITYYVTEKQRPEPFTQCVECCAYAGPVRLS